MKKFLWKTKTTFSRLFPPCIACALGAFLLYLPFAPGTTSNILAWCETEGGPLVQSTGTLVVLLGIFWLYYSLKALRHERFVVIYPLRCSIHQNMFTNIFRRIWKEYFRQDLQVHVLCKKKGLVVRGDIPATWDDKNDLEPFLSKRIFSLTGYWGPIRLQLSHQKAEKEPTK